MCRSPRLPPESGIRQTYLLATAACALVSANLGLAQGSAHAVADSVRLIIARADLPAATRGDFARWRPELQRLYSAAGDALLWTVDGRPTAQADTVIAVLQSAPALGLAAGAYDAAKLAAQARVLAAAGRPAPRDIERFDVWLSLSLMRYAQHAHAGRVDPRSLRFALPAEQKRLDLTAIALDASRASDVRSQLAALEPRSSRYALLKTALSRYQVLATDTALHAPPAVAKSVRPGDSWAGVPAVRRLLVALGDLPEREAGAAAPAQREVYDSALVDGVRRFQSRHGLDVDGVLGRATVEQMRQPLASRVRQIELALERWRWLPDDTSARFVLVNIPEFRVRGFERDAAGDRPVMTMDIIVGEAVRRRFTPVFTATMRQVTFRPYWDVPLRIARNEETPKIRRRPGYFGAEAFEIVSGDGENALRHPPTPENLSKVDAGLLRLRQRPGDKNALGLAKFIFPNPNNTYLHGTPAQYLFDRSRRDFSHGCMRLRDPAAFAEFVLSQEGGWDRAKINSAMHGERTMPVDLAHPFPVYVMYLTVMPSDSGSIQFANDIYRHDAALARALQAQPR